MVNRSLPARFFSGVLLALIRFYQWGISPLLGANCRFQPTCSQYFAEAVREWGPLKGSRLGFKRISKCHPWGSHGHDPVPRKKELKENNDVDQTKKKS